LSLRFRGLTNELELISMTFPSLRAGHRLMAVLAGMALLLAACGDDSGGSTATLSEDDFVAAYSSICSGVDEQIGALQGDDLESAKVASVAAKDIVDDAIAALEALNAPDDIAEQADEGTAALAKTSDVFDRLSTVDNEQEFGETALEIDEARAEAQEALEPLGINCEEGADADDGSTDGGSDGSADDTSGDETDADDGGSSDGDSVEASPAADIAEYGTDADLDALADACEGGLYDACDDLFLRSEGDSGYEDYGDSCGGRNEPSGFCSTIYG
jgi:hypothetical protein